MDAGIGASRAGHLHRFRKELRERQLQRAGDRARLRLPLKAREVRPVIFDGETERRQRCARSSSALAAAKSRWNAGSCIITYAASVPAVQPDATSLG